MSNHLAAIQRESPSYNIVQCDGIDIPKSSPNYKPSTSQAVYDFPCTLQSYPSCSFQNNDNTAISPPNFPNVPASQQCRYQNFPNLYDELSEFINIDPNQAYKTEKHRSDPSDSFAAIPAATSMHNNINYVNNVVVHPAWARKGDELLNPWPHQTQQQQQANMFQGGNRLFLNDPGEQKMYMHMPIMQDTNTFASDQKLFQSHQIDNQNILDNSVSSSNLEIGSVGQQPYRTSENLQTIPAYAINSTQVPEVLFADPVSAPAANKNINCKSNIKSKTFKCTACDRWFTSSSHLKRHYNTALHKYAVNYSSQPDPATLPSNSHHRPSTEATSSKNDNQNLNITQENPRCEESNGVVFHHEDQLISLPDLSHMMEDSVFSGGPSNGEAVLSSPDSGETTGLQLPITTANNSFNMMPLVHTLPTEALDFQMSSNVSAPHVTQATDITMSVLPLDTSLFDLNTSEQENFMVALESVLAPNFTNENNTNELFTGELSPLTDSPLNQQPVPNIHHCSSSGSSDFSNSNDRTIHEQCDAIQHLDQPLNGPFTDSSTTELSKRKCFECDKIFSRPCYLTQHNRTCHSGDKPYKCPICGKNFATEEICQTHTSKHTGEKPHKCDMCPKMFNHKPDLRRHIRSHTEKKPYACDICGKDFIRKDHMVKHKDTHRRKKKVQ